MMANDPHRAQSVPSLRYWVHLVAPGWNVIGGGEPAIPGVSIGHNEYGAWGLTIFATDGEDLYVYETNPANPRQYRYRGAWETMTSIRETIPGEGRRRRSTSTLRYTRHGPVVYEDTVHHVAYAVRAAWLEPGSSPYLASLRMDQAKTWERVPRRVRVQQHPRREHDLGRQAREHRLAGGRHRADSARTGAGSSPCRATDATSGPAISRSRRSRTRSIRRTGFIATANNDLIPRRLPAHGRGRLRVDRSVSLGADLRGARLRTEVRGRRHDASADRLHVDSSRASSCRCCATCRRRRRRRESTARDSTLLAWDFVLDKNSVAAGIYEAWFRHLGDDVSRVVIPAAARPFFRTLGASRLIERSSSPGRALGANPAAARDTLLMTSLAEAVADLTQRYGANDAAWAYGQPSYHYALISHPLSTAVNDALRAEARCGPAPRGGDANTVGATGNGGNQTSGASFRIVVDVGDWERTVGMNTPGQSGDPDKSALQGSVRAVGERPLLPGAVRAAARRSSRRSAMGAGPGQVAVFLETE